MDANTLQRIRLFGRLNHETLTVLCQIATPIKAARGQVIIREGETNSTLYLLEEGSLHVHLKVEDKKVFAGRLEEGSVFGEISLFDPGPATASVTAATDASLYEIRHEDFEKLINEQPAIACSVVVVVLKDLARRFRLADQRLQAANLLSGGLRP